MSPEGVAFNLVAVATTCGFVAQDFALCEPVFAPLVMLMLICRVQHQLDRRRHQRCSTLVLFRQAGRELLMLVHPQAVRPVRIGGRRQNQIVFAVLAFVVLFRLPCGVVADVCALVASGLGSSAGSPAIIACMVTWAPASARGRAGGDHGASPGSRLGWHGVATGSN